MDKAAIPESFFVDFSPHPTDFLQRPPVVVMGNIDGVHRGHQELVRRAVERARPGGHPVVVLTFSPHPVEVLNPKGGLKRIFPPADQQALLKRFGADGVYYQKFDAELAQTEALDFLDRYVVPELHPRAIVVGYNFRFGKNRSGDPKTLEKWGKERGVEIEIVPAMKAGDEVISSSLIRAHLQQGEVDRAGELLGFPFFIRGVVTTGSQRGRALGFPTANIDCPKTLLPHSGVYATRVKVGGQGFPAVSHLGNVPTFGDERVRLETFVLDFSGELYEQEVVVEFLKKIRDVKKFSGVEELRQQIEKDVAEARKLHRK